VDARPVVRYCLEWHVHFLTEMLRIINSCIAHLEPLTDTNELIQNVGMCTHVPKLNRALIPGLRQFVEAVQVQHGISGC
jgi:hypothetical protein